MNSLKKIFSHNWLATFFINFKMLPLKQAVKLPIDVYGKIKFQNLSGTISISSEVRRSIVKVGAQGSDMFPNQITVLDLKGKLDIQGTNISIGAGTLLKVETNGTVSLGNNVVIGAKSVLLSESEIKIDDDTITSWNCQIMDTDTHSIVDTLTEKMNNRTLPVYIGKKCWLGNNVFINKGARIPSDVIVASFSLCNKDYITHIRPNSVLGGVPAQLIAENKKKYNDKLGQ